MARRCPKEQMHRIAYTKLSETEIGDRLEAVDGPTSVSPLADHLTGRTLRVVTDRGPTLEYRFASGTSLVDMARLQGEGVLVQPSSHTLELRCARIAGAWRLEQASLTRREHP